MVVFSFIAFKNLNYLCLAKQKAEKNNRKLESHQLYTNLERDFLLCRSETIKKI